MYSQAHLRLVSLLQSQGAGALKGGDQKVGEENAPQGQLTSTERVYRAPGHLSPSFNGGTFFETLPRICNQMVSDKQSQRKWWTERRRQMNNEEERRFRSHNYHLLCLAPCRTTACPPVLQPCVKMRFMKHAHLALGLTTGTPRLTVSSFLSPTATWRSIS